MRKRNRNKSIRTETEDKKQKWNRKQFSLVTMILTYVGVPSLIPGLGISYFRPKALQGSLQYCQLCAEIASLALSIQVPFWLI
jgi:hypothetical protein